MEIKTELKKGDDDIYSLSVDCGDFHYSKHSHDKELLKVLFSMINIIRLGIKKEGVKYEK